MKVLVTRAEGPGKRTAERLRRAGYYPVLLPLMEYRDTGATLTEGPFDAIVFTGAAAIAILSARIAADDHLAGLFRLPAFCVGEATAKAALASGFEHALAGPGTAAELVDFIAGNLSLKGSADGPPALLYPAPAERAFDLANAAGARGIAIAEVIIYSAEMLDPGAGALGGALDQCAGGAALLYSRRSAEHLLALATKRALQERLAGLTLIAISENVAETIAGRGPRVLVSQLPYENGLFELLDQLAGGGATLQG